MSATLVIQFQGWCIIRIPTDPDPPDEARGVSGYTFAFAGEPDLDRIVHLQPPVGFVPRSHGPSRLGVFVTRAQRLDASGAVEILGLIDARVELLGEPRLENRNWTLTLPGFEPIYPFYLSITGAGIRIRRSAPFDPDNPDQPLWQVPQVALLSHGAQGMEYEPETTGRATGIWNPLLLVTERKRLLEKDLATATDLVARTALEGRISELDIGIANPNDRRVRARLFVERFGFALVGRDTEIQDDSILLASALDGNAPWPISFWLGSWDPDLLCAYMQGSLQIPYLAPPSA